MNKRSSTQNEQDRTRRRMNYFDTVLVRDRIPAEVDTTNENGMVSMITLRPIRQINRMDVPITLVTNFATEIRTLLYISLRTLGYSDLQISNRTRISIFMYNWNNDGNTNARTNVSISALNGDTFMEMFEEATATGSNPLLDLFDVVWKVWLNPNSVNAAGSNAKESKVPGLYAFNWTPAKHASVVVSRLGCAAKVLMYGKSKKEDRYAQPTREKSFTKDIYDLQTKMKFHDPLDVTVIELYEFVLLYPNYRVAIYSLVSVQPTIYTGAEYIHDTTVRTDLTLYIYHDLANKHYRYMSSPLEYFKATLKIGGSFKWCYRCCSGCRSGEKHSCMCGTIQGVKQRTYIKECEYCKTKTYNLKLHRCGEKQCHYCQLYYKEKEVGNHRCPLYIDSAKTCKVFIGDENEALRKEYATLGKKEQKDYELWVWDIESHFIHTDQIDNRYLVDENGLFVLNNGVVQIKLVTKLAQLGNYVYCMNVFTGVEKEFNSLEEFLVFTQANNDGTY